MLHSQAQILAQMHGCSSTNTGCGCAVQHIYSSSSKGTKVMNFLRKIGEKIMMVADLLVEAKLTQDRMVAEAIRRHRMGN